MVVRQDSEDQQQEKTLTSPERFSDVYPMAFVTVNANEDKKKNVNFKLFLMKSKSEKKLLEKFAKHM